MLYVYIFRGSAAKGSATVNSDNRDNCASLVKSARRINRACPPPSANRNKYAILANSDPCAHSTKRANLASCTNQVHSVNCANQVHLANSTSRANNTNSDRANRATYANRAKRGKLTTEWRQDVEEERRKSQREDKRINR